MSIQNTDKRKRKRISYIRGGHMDVSFDAPPLDFSFKDLKDLSHLLYEKHRKGRNKDRKPISEKKDPKKKDKKELNKEEIGRASCRERV